MRGCWFVVAALLGSLLVCGCGRPFQPIDGDGGLHADAPSFGADSTVPGQDSRVSNPDSGIPSDAARDVADALVPDVAVGYQIDEAHSGGITGTGLAPPLRMRWSVALPGPSSYPIIAGGQVFVTTALADGTTGTRLHALDATSGGPTWGPIDIAGTNRWSAAAYGDGAVYVINNGGLLQAFEADSGSTRWTAQLPGQDAYTSVPNFYAGTVYLSSSGSARVIYAVEAASGRGLWSQPTGHGNGSSPVVSSLGVFDTYECEQFYGFNLTSGEVLADLEHGPDSACNGKGGRSPALYRDLLYYRDLVATGLVIDTRSGAPVSSFATEDVIPAFQDGVVLARRAIYLTAMQVPSGNRDEVQRFDPLWTLTHDGMTSAPIVVDGYVYMGTTTAAGGGELLAVDAGSGGVAWSTDLGAPVAAPVENDPTRPLPGLSAAPGLLVVPAGTQLFAFD
jgi:outer membrane protein assembly factor BamB